MTGTEVYNDLNNELTYIGGVKTSTEALYYINRTIDYLSFRLAKMNYGGSIAEASIVTGADVPANYIETCGTFPIKRTGSKFYFLSGAPASITLRYKFSQPHITAITDTIPFPDHFKGVFVMVATMFAQNRNEQNIAQDTQITQMLLEAING
jgi:hypothetical protein